MGGGGWNVGKGRRLAAGATGGMRTGHPVNNREGGGTGRMVLTGLSAIVRGGQGQVCDGSD